MTMVRPVEILLVEDDEADVLICTEALRDAKVHNKLHLATNGEEALAFLKTEPPFEEARRPDVILLDLNLPRMDGRELLAVIKTDPNLRRIPVVVLTTSHAEEDIIRSYDLAANCYITKPLGFDKFLEVIRSIEHFWLTIVELPPA